MNVLLWILTALLVIGCNGQPSNSSLSLPGRLLDKKPTEIGKYKDEGDQAHWWIDEQRTLLDWEAEKGEKRVPTDTIVIHHTAGVAGRTWQELSALQYQTLYVPRFKPAIPDPHIPTSVSVQSGHFRLLADGPNKGKWQEVFYAYHWLIREDGTKLRLLEDNEVGWESGNWDVNMRAIAICFDGNLVGREPTPAAMKAAAELIRNYKKKYAIKDEKIIGHYDVTATQCPGEWFRSGGKEKLLKLAH